MVEHAPPLPCIRRGAPKATAMAEGPHPRTVLERGPKMIEERPPQFIAHVREDRDGKFVIHELEDHLCDVAKLVGEFAQDFGS